MTSLTQLIDEKKALDARIAAAKAEAAQNILAQMETLGLTLADLGVAPRVSTSKRPVKYRDAGGNAWTGVGQRPRWLRAAILAGATLESFAVKD